MKGSFKKGAATVGLLCLTACSGQVTEPAALRKTEATKTKSARKKGPRDRFGLGAQPDLVLPKDRTLGVPSKPQRPVMAGLLAFAADVESPTVTPGVEEPARDEVGRNPEFCPAWTESDLHRARRSVRVRPGDDWIATVEGAAPGTEVLFAPGEYRIGNELNIDVGEGVTLRGETGDPRDVVLMGDGYDVESEGLTIRGRDVSIVDLSVTGVRAHAIFVKGDQGAHGLQVYNVRLYDTGTQHIKLTPGGAQDGLVACSEIFYNPGKVRGDYIDAIDLHEAVGWTIRDNYIHDIEGEHNGCYVDISCETYESGPAILVWNNSRDTVIERNVLVDNFRNIALGLGRGHEGGVVRNNYIRRSRRTGESGIELQTASGTQVVHNTVFLPDFPNAVEVRDSDDIVLKNNLMSSVVWDRGGSTFTERGDIHDATAGDFVSAEDYRLKPGSHAVGAGVAANDVAEDIEGQPRGGAPDVGCDQVD